MTVNIKGKDYVTAAERLTMVRESGKAFEILESAPLAIGERVVWRVTIKVDGLQYAGSAECHLDAKPGSADATDPFACGETSAVARALGFAGFGSAGDIASADEIVVRTQAKQPTTNGHKPPENALRLNELFEGGKLKKMWRNRREMLVKVSEMLESTVTDANIGELDSSLLDYIAEVIEKTPQF